LSQNQSCAEKLVRTQIAVSGFKLDGIHALSLAGAKPAGTVRPAMQDVTMLLFTVVFFVLAFLYVMACQKLR
jgi:hypothetical protein